MERIHIKTSFSLNKYSIVFFLLVGLPSLLLGVEPCTSGYSVKSPSLLSRYSLEAYLPEIGDQGDVGSCVGWASAYYGLTVVKRIEHGRNYPEFSALSAYNRYCFFYDKNPCYGGSQIDGSLEVLKTYGSPLMDEYPLQNCAHDPDKTKYKDRLFDYERLQHMNYMQLKAAINNNRPVVIGMNVYAGGKGNSLNTKFLDSNGVIKIENFNFDYAVAGHAMCIIGYDDNIGGGAFKLVNSWGKEWGKSGFCWLRYKDLEILRVAFSLIPNDLALSTKVSDFKTKSIKVCNNSSKSYYVSYGITNTDDVQQVRGWYYIPAGSSRELSIGNRKKNEVFYVLMNEEGEVFESKNSTANFPTDRDKYFDSKLKKDEKEAPNSAYFSFIPGNKKKTQQLFITGSSAPIVLD
jgi:hypothetical protein